MTQEIGETREAWGQDVWKMAEEMAHNMKKIKKPFYIVYACKQDKAQSNKLGYPVFKQAFKAYHATPPAILGILVWYVDHRIGKFEFVPALSSPPDVPLDPALLSDKASDASPRIAAQGEKLHAILS